MGYRRERTVHKLRFDETQGDLAGLEVKLYSLSVGQMLDLSRLADGARQQTGDANMMFTQFAESLVGWNLEDEVPDATGVGARPVPPTLDGVRSCDLDFILRLVHAWMDAIAGVSAPLAGRSNSGPPFPEGSLPMEPLSPNQTN